MGYQLQSFVIDYQKMEKAVLKTLAYYDVFDFPLKAWEVHKWLTGKKATLVQVEDALIRLEKKNRIARSRGYWYLAGKKKTVKQRESKEKISSGHINLAGYVGALLRLIPWVKMVGISGSLALSASKKEDDIDLFIITDKHRIWISRFLLILLTSAIGLRRSRREKKLSAAGKICINLILERSNLAQKKRNIYVAHEVLQMRPLWQKQQIYSDFLHANSWAFKYLPNWKSSERMDRKNWNNGNFTEAVSSGSLSDLLENFAQKIQLNIMKKPQGKERIETGALYFHPEDKGVKILSEYRKRIAAL